MPADSRLAPVTDTDLIFLKNSPSYCNKTSGRRCKINSKKKKNKNRGTCDMMCCGQGYRTKVRTVTKNCHCKFIWCCRVTCEKCYHKQKVYTCKWWKMVDGFMKWILQCYVEIVAERVVSQFSKILQIKCNKKKIQDLISHLKMIAFFWKVPRDQMINNKEVTYTHFMVLISLYYLNKCSTDHDTSSDHSQPITRHLDGYSTNHKAFW